MLLRGVRNVNTYCEPQVSCTQGLASKPPPQAPKTRRDGGYMRPVEFFDPRRFVLHVLAQKQDMVQFSDARHPMHMANHIVHRTPAFAVAGVSSSSRCLAASCKTLPLLRFSSSRAGMWCPGEEVTRYLPFVKE